MKLGDILHFARRFPTKMYAILTIFLLWTTTVLAEQKCCPGINVLTGKQCDNNSTMLQLPCRSKFLVHASESDDIKILPNSNLQLGEHESDSTRFCWSQMMDEEKQLLETVYLVCFPDESSFDAQVVPVYYILAFISSFFLFGTTVIYLLCPNLLDILAQCFLHSITGLGTSFLILGLTNVVGNMGNTECHLMAYLLYVSFLYAFFWLNILSFHIWRKTMRPKILRGIKRWMMIYYIFGIGGPICLLLILALSHHTDLQFFEGMKPRLAEEKCWFRSLRETMIYFYGPISVLLCANIMYYIWTICILCKQMHRSAKVLKYRLMLCIKMFFIMGITWTLEVISAVLEYENQIVRILWFITDCINGMQGIFIFLILVVFRKKVVRELAGQNICYIQLPVKWKNLKDEECDDDLEDEISLSEIPPGEKQ